MLRRWKKKTAASTVWLSPDDEDRRNAEWTGTIEKGDEFVFPDGTVCRFNRTGQYSVRIGNASHDDMFEDELPSVVERRL